MCVFVCVCVAKKTANGLMITDVLGAMGPLADW